MRAISFILSPDSELQNHGLQLNLAVIITDPFDRLALAPLSNIAIKLPRGCGQRRILIKSAPIELDGSSVALCVNFLKRSRFYDINAPRDIIKRQKTNITLQGFCLEEIDQDHRPEETDWKADSNHATSETNSPETPLARDSNAFTCAMQFVYKDQNASGSHDSCDAQSGSREYRVEIE